MAVVADVAAAPEQVGVLKQLVTLKDNRTHDLGSWIALVGAIAGIVMSIDGHFSPRPFDIQGYGIGLGALVGAIKCSQALQDRTP